MLSKYSYIGVDIGGTKINIALIDIKGNILYSQSMPTAENLKTHVLIRNIASIIQYIKTRFSSKNIFGIGMGAAGIIEHTRGIIRFSPNIGWRNFSISDSVAKATGLPVVLDNDANAAAWGTFYLNYFKKYNHLLCVTLGTGIGGGLVLNGDLYRGANGYAGEIGHMTLIPNGLKCSCSNTGCLESYAGTKGIINRTEKALKDYPKSIIPKCSKDGKITPESITEAAVVGDELAIKIWEETGEILGIAFASIVNLLNLEVIHITGGVSQAQKWMEDSILDTIKEKAFADPASKVKVIFGTKKKDMGVMGAGLLVLEKYRHNLIR